MKTFLILLSTGFLLTIVSFSAANINKFTNSNSNPELMKVMIQSNIDLVVRINSTMTDDEVLARINTLDLLLDNFEIEYKRNDKGEIDSLACTSERFIGSSDNFGFIVLVAKDRMLESISINDKDN